MNRVSRENRIRCEYVQESCHERVERIHSTISASANAGFPLQLSWKKFVTLAERRKCRNKRMQTYFDTPQPSRLNAIACGTDPLHPLQASKFLSLAALNCHNCHHDHSRPCVHPSTTQPSETGCMKCPCKYSASIQKQYIRNVNAS